MWRWFDPIEELKRMQERVERLLGELEVKRPLPGEIAEFAVDMLDEDDQIRIVADLPGFKKEDIEVAIEDSYLKIRAERKEEKEEKVEGYLRQERKYGVVKRRILLPAEVKIDEVKSTYNNGVLEVILPKTVAAKKKKIDID